MKSINIIMLALFLIVLGTDALAQQNVIGGLGGSPGASLTVQGLYNVIVTLACWLAQISIVIMVIAMIFYGLMFIWSQGNPTSFSAAKSAFGWGIVGVLVILGTYTIIASVATFIDPNYDYQLILSPFGNCADLISKIK